MTRSKPRFDHLVEIAAHLAVEVLDEPPLVAPGERVRLDEPLGQPDHADLEAAAEGHVSGGAERDLDAAAADVDHDGGRAADVDAVAGREVNQPGFFGAGR